MYLGETPPMFKLESKKNRERVQKIRDYLLLMGKERYRKENRRLYFHGKKNEDHVFLERKAKIGL